MAGEGKWTIIARTGTPPAPRCGSTMTFVGRPGAADSGLILAFGETSKLTAAGAPTDERVLCDDVFKFDRAGWNPLTARTPVVDTFVPMGRTDHAAVAFGSPTQHVFYFGGKLQSSFLDDTFILKDACNSPSWVPIYSVSSPVGRRGHSLCTVTTPSAVGATEAIFMFGGQRGSLMLNDAWLFDLNRETWNSLPARGDVPSARMYASVFSPLRGVMLLVGGTTGATSASSEVYGYDLREGRWMKKEAKELPPFGDYTGCHFLPESRQLLIFDSHPATKPAPAPPTPPPSVATLSAAPLSPTPAGGGPPGGVGRGAKTMPSPGPRATTPPPAATAAPVLEECLYLMDANPRSPALGTCRVVPTGGQKSDARHRVASSLVITGPATSSESKVEIFTYGGAKETRQLSGGLRCLTLTLVATVPRRVPEAGAEAATAAETKTETKGAAAAAAAAGGAGAATGAATATAAPAAAAGTGAAAAGAGGASSSTATAGATAAASPAKGAAPAKTAGAAATDGKEAKAEGKEEKTTRPGSAGGAGEGKEEKKEKKKETRMKKVKLSQTPVKSRAIPAADLEVIELGGAGVGGKRRLISRSLHVNEQDQTLVAQIIKLLLIKPWHTPPRETRSPFFLTAPQIMKLVEEARVCVSKEDTMVELTAPVKVFGDIHGQMEDLRRLFKAFGSPNHKTGDVGVFKYIFTGDFVDRGQSSLEVICLLMALKIRYWGRVYLIRGNHEDRMINGHYGFYQECKERLGDAGGELVWKACNDFFMWLPLAARINKKVLCIHGGIGRIRSLAQIARIKRPIDPDHSQTSTDEAQQCLLDLLWSDPSESEEDKGIKANVSRGGTSVVFGADVVKEFCKANDIELIIRAHQVVAEGYEYFADGHLITVFSATNYCGRDKNCGAFLELVDINDIVLVTPKQIEPFLDGASMWLEQGKARPPSPMRSGPRHTIATAGSTGSKTKPRAHFTL